MQKFLITEADAALYAAFFFFFLNVHALSCLVRILKKTMVFQVNIAVSSYVLNPILKSLIVLPLFVIVPLT